MIFAIPAQSISVKQVSQLRKMVPEDTKVQTDHEYSSGWWVGGLGWGRGDL